MFTDFRNWNYRMQYIAGSTVSVSATETLIKIPKSARKEVKPRRLAGCSAKSSFRMRFELTRGNPNGLAVHRLNHSAT